MTAGPDTRWQRWAQRLRRLRRRCWKAGLWFIVASAVLVSLGRLFAPYSDMFRPALEGFLSGMFGQPVSIERVEARWPRLSPQVELHGLRVGPEDNPLLHAEQAQLEARLYNLIHPGRNSLELVVVGLELVLAQDEEGHWSWRLDRGGNFAEGWEQIISAGDISLRASKVRVSPQALPELNWSVPEAGLSRSGASVLVLLQALPAVTAGESLEVRLRLEMPDSRLAAVQAYAVSPNFALTHLAMESTDAAVDDLRAQMQAWFEWQRGGDASLHARLDLHSLAAEGIAGRVSSRFEVDGYWRPQAYGIELNAREFGEQPPALIDRLAWVADGERMALAADHAELDYLHALLTPWLDFHPHWPRSLGGTARDLQLGGDLSGSLFSAGGSVEEFQVELPGFSVDGLSLELGLSGDRLSARVGGAVRVGLPDLYPGEIAFQAVEGRLRAGAALLEIDGLKLQHHEFDARVDGRIGLAEQTPVLDLLVDLPRLEPESPRVWLPRAGIPENTRDWLNKALEHVDSIQAVTTLFGDPSGWHKRIAAGALHSVATFRGLRLRYADDWPVAQALDGTVEFSGQRMLAEIVHGRAAGVALRAPRVYIANTRNAEVELSLETVDATATQLGALVGAMPLARVDDALAALEWHGAADAVAQVLLPVKRKQDWELDGHILFGGAGLSVVPHGVRLDNIVGRVGYSREDIGPAELSASIDGMTTELSLQGRLVPDFQLNLIGVIPGRSLLPDDWRDGVEDFIDGSARFALNFVPDSSSESTPESGHVLEIRSDLQGVALTFPQPLTKSASEDWPLEMQVPLGGRVEPSGFRLADRLSGALLAEADFWQLGLGLGGHHVDLPMADNFIIEGRAEAFELDRWIDLAGRILGAHSPHGNASQRDLSGWLNVSMDDLVVGESSLGPVSLAMTREGDYWRLDSDGERVRGTLRLPAADRVDRDIVADFSRLHWPGIAPDREPKPIQPSQADPRQSPAFSIIVRDLRWGDLDVGEFRASAFREEQGLQIEQFSTRRDGLELSGSGVWRGEADGPATRMRLRLTADDFGQTLNAAGYGLALQRGNAVIGFDGQWPGSPLDFALEQAEGRLEVTISEGAIPEASPGAGRLLGLVSLNSIPRRLRLDFSDVFGEGLAFDRISGSFELADGVATTDDLRIGSPAAEIRIRGRTDLRHRSYDQTVIVRPGFGSTLPIIGLLAGGPVGAAAGAALQQIFSRPLGGISEIRYSVTGPMDDPQIRPVDVREE